MSDYPIRAYTKKELALLYFPQTEDPHIAVNRLMSWINRCTPLHDSMRDMGYKKQLKGFTPKEVKLIFEFLGTP